MEMSQTAWLIVGAFVGIGLVVLMRRFWQSTRPRAICRHCGSTDLRELKRETLGSRTIETAYGGSESGGDIRLQLDLEVTYHCNVCRKESKVTVTKTQ